MHTYVYVCIYVYIYYILIVIINMITTTCKMAAGGTRRCPGICSGVKRTAVAGRPTSFLHTVFMQLQVCPQRCALPSQNAQHIQHF